jgi:hypothetical protein
MICVSRGEGRGSGCRPRRALAKDGANQAAGAVVFLMGDQYYYSLKSVEEYAAV